MVPNIKLYCLLVRCEKIIQTHCLNSSLFCISIHGVHGGHMGPMEPPTGPWSCWGHRAVSILYMRSQQLLNGHATFCLGPRSQGCASWARNPKETQITPFCHQSGRHPNILHEINTSWRRNPLRISPDRSNPLNLNLFLFTILDQSFMKKVIV